MTWQELSALRERGQRPRTLCITTDFWRCREQADKGSMVVVHKPGKALPLELLEGLNVELHLDDCSQAFRLAKAMKARVIEWGNCASWCRCEQRMSICIAPDCQEAQKDLAFWESLFT